MPQSFIGRLGSAQSVSAGSVAASSTAVFGAGTRVVRVIATQPCAILISEAPGVSSTPINSGGAILAANVAEYFYVTPGQRMGIAAASATSVVNVVEIT